MRPSTAYATSTDAAKPVLYSLFLHGALAVLDLNERAVLITLVQVRVENVSDQSPLIDQGAAAVRGDGRAHGVAPDHVIGGCFALGVDHDFDDVAADSWYYESRGRDEPG